MNEFRPYITQDARTPGQDRLARARANQQPPWESRRHRFSRLLRSASERLDS